MAIITHITVLKFIRNGKSGVHLEIYWLQLFYPVQPRPVKHGGSTLYAYTW